MTPEERILTMPKRLVRKWIAALQSGEYKQGKDRLYDPKTDRYCCLGVLAICAGLKQKDLYDYPLLDDGPHYLADLNIRTDWECNTDWEYKYARMNDQGKTFKTIAREIEGELETQGRLGKGTPNDRSDLSP